MNGNASADIDFNPNNSFNAIEGLCSPDGRVYGKMGHSERIGENVAKNVYLDMQDINKGKNQKLFEAGVSYFK